MAGSGDERSETGALKAVCSALGGSEWERTGQESSKPDGVIRFPDGSEADLEVYREVIPEFRQANAELERIDEVRSLPRGTGSWVALFPLEVPIKDVSALSDEDYLRAISAFLVGPGRRSSVSGVDIAGHRGVVLMHMSVGDDAITIGVTTAARLRSRPINTHLDSVAVFVQQELPIRSEKIQMLIQRAIANHRKAHVAVVIEETENTGMYFALCGVGASSDVMVPGIDVDLPAGLDGFWVVRGDHQFALGIVRGVGWMRYEGSAA